MNRGLLWLCAQDSLLVGAWDACHTPAQLPCPRLCLSQPVLEMSGLLVHAALYLVPGIGSLSPLPNSGPRQGSIVVLQAFFLGWGWGVGAGNTQKTRRHLQERRGVRLNPAFIIHQSPLPTTSDLFHKSHKVSHRFTGQIGQPGLGLCWAVHSVSKPMVLEWT